MSFGSILSGVYHAITPWHDSGKVFSRASYQPQKKKRQNDQSSQPTQNVAATDQQPQLKVQRPENLFESLNEHLAVHNPAPNPAVTVTSTPANQPTLVPPPGTVVQPQRPAPVQPQRIVTNIPDHSVWGHIKSGLKTAGQTAVGTVANVPEVALAAGRAGTGLIQGAAHLPSLATHALTYVPRRVAGDNSAINRVLSTTNRGVDTATSYVDKPFNAVNRGLDRAAQGYERVVPQAAAGAQVYRREQIPLNILAGLLTLGGSTAAKAGGSYKLGEVNNPGRVTQFLNKPRVSNADNIVSKIGQAIGNKATPVVQPLFTPIRSARAGVTRLINGRNVSTAERETVDAGEVGNVLSNPQLDELTAPPTQVPVTQQGGNVPIPVGIPRPGAPIRELGGDTPGRVQLPTSDELAAQRARNSFDNQVPGRPDTFVEGVTPRKNEPFKLNENTVKTSQDDLVNQYSDFLKSVGEGNGVNITADGRRVSNNFRDSSLKGKRMTKQDWRDEAQRQLDAGKADPSIQKAFDEAKNPDVQSLLSQGERPPLPEGRPITVKEVKGIDVIDKTEVSQNLPEVPGTVRVTSQTSPMVAKSEAVANQPVTVPPPTLPEEVQHILDNPKQYNKRQLASARHQRTLAKQLAKTRAETQAVINNSPELAPKPEGSPGFVSTGEFRKGENGNVSEVAHQDTEAAQAASDTANLSSADVLNKANQDITQNGVVSPESVRNLQAMLDSGRFTQTSPEYRAIAKTLYGAVSDYGRGLSLFNPTLRRTASGDQLTNRFVSKLYGVVEDGSKLSDSHIAAVSRADNTFTAARDAANQALDRYNATKSATDFNAWKEARQAADDAEKQALITEYKVANDVLKGNKDPAALKAVQEAEKSAGVYKMDWIDANMLSGTGTATRNFVNTALVRLENSIFGRIGGGYSGKGAKIGNKVGLRSVKTDFNARNHLDENALTKSVKQWSTTANTLGEGNIKAVGSARAYKYYENELKAQGVKGDQLARDTEVMLHNDPDKMAQHYDEWALKENALSGLAHSKKFEQALVDTLSGGRGKLAQTSVKALVRLTVGFPTVIGRSLVGGAKRATVGLPEFANAGIKLAKGDKQAAVDALYDAKVHLGSGASLYALGTVLANAGVISPSYPTDKAERARWKAEGIQPNSIKIGGNWFSIPGYFGALALPFTIPANILNKNSPAEIAKGVISGVQDLAPTAGVVNFVNGMEGRGGDQWLKSELTSLTRATATPVGALLAQIAKMTDSTKNDTTTKDGIHNLLDSIASGIPGVNNAVNKIPATDDNGNELHNPNPVATLFGAQGAQQGRGVEDTKQAQSTANDTYKQLEDYGILKDKTLTGLIDKKVQAKIARGQDLTPEEITKVQKAVVKGVSDSGEDTAYLEKEQYDTNLAVLKVKRDMLSSDPTTKPSSLKDLDTAIKRGGIYKEHKIPYEMIDAYKTTSASDWRKMGIPPGDKKYDPDLYDPEMYQKLWDMDQLMTKAGVSYRKGHLDKNKYSAAEAGDGKGRGRGVKQLDTSFGTLKDSKFAPSVQQYDTIDTKSGIVPRISVVRPNIVHKITSSG